jgi:dihydrofolate reductase
MSKVILYIAASLDGYIARPNGDVDWLDKYLDDTEDYGYTDFYKSVGTVVMGRKTYDQVLTFGAWPYKGAKTYVVTSAPKAFRFAERAKDSIEAYSGNLPELISKIKRESHKDIWLVGGGELIAGFINDYLIDEVIITIVPRILGTGIPLFKPNRTEVSMVFKYEKSYLNGVIQLSYSLI